MWLWTGSTSLDSSGLRCRTGTLISLKASFVVFGEIKQRSEERGLPRVCRPLLPFLLIEQEATELERERQRGKGGATRDTLSHSPSACPQSRTLLSCLSPGWLSWGPSESESGWWWWDYHQVFFFMSSDSKPVKLQIRTEKIG